MFLKESVFVLLALSALAHGRSIDLDSEENAVEQNMIVVVPAQSRNLVRRQAMSEEELQKLLASLGGAGLAPPGGDMGDLTGDLKALISDLTSLGSGFDISKTGYAVPMPPPNVVVLAPPPPPPSPAPAPAPAPVVAAPAPPPPPPPPMLVQMEVPPAAPEMVTSSGPTTFGAIDTAEAPPYTDFTGGSPGGMDFSGGSSPDPFGDPGSFSSGGSIADFSSGSSMDTLGMNPVSSVSDPAGGSLSDPSMAGGSFSDPSMSGGSLDATRAGSLTDPSMLGGDGGVPGVGAAPEEAKSKTRVNAIKGPKKASLETPAGAKEATPSVGRSLGGAGYGATSEDRKTVGSLADYIKQTPKAVLKDGEAIEPGKMLEVPGCDFKLVHQKDGNVVLHWGGEGHVEWSSKTAGVGGNGAYTLRMDKGVLSLYGPGWRKGSRRVPIWKTEGSDGATMAVLLRDGNLALVTDGGDIKWATNTIAKIPCKGEESVAPRIQA